MKGFAVAMLWGFVLLLVLGLTYPIWSWSINSIVTSAGGDAFSVLLADTIFVIICIATLGAIVLYKSNPRLDNRWIQ